MTATEIRDTNRATQSRPWTSKEVQALRESANLGAQAVAELLDRTVQSVRQAAKRHRISLRRTGSRAGLILGQPRGVSFTDVRTSAAEVGALAEIRQAVLDGETDPARLEQLVDRYTRWIAAGAPLCPACAARPAENPRSGFCQPCHLRQLAQAHRDDRATQESKREHARERQRAVRRRRRAERDRTPRDTTSTRPWWDRT